ncbi:Eukaryotic translation initiation factor [Fasciola gigantica]|uniref:Eukaryotic translation initiation factor 4C n=1 Tax=Fasciola gigantica TaxID=46835 RepID=A0A504YA44_FASGI|nr:Eukaryotic translation initiation factor [Fasciola gigantica]
MYLEYAKVERLLGNGRLEAYCFDGVKRLCHIRGKLRKKVWISNGDIILVGLRDYQDKKADVIMKYLNDEARTLKSLGEIPDTVKLEENTDIEFDANAALFEGDEEASDSDEEEQSDEDSDATDDSDNVAESIQRYRSDYGNAKDSRNTRRK